MIQDKNEKSSLDKLINYRQGKEVDINEKEKDFDEKIDYADNLIREYRTQKKCIPMLMHKFPGMSRSTAWRIFVAAKYVHGSLNKYDKEYERIANYEKLMELADKLWSLNPAKYAKTIILSISKASSIMGLDVHEDEKINPDDLLQHNYLLVMNLKLTGSSALINLPTAHKLKQTDKDRLEEEYRAQTKYTEFEDL